VTAERLKPSAGYEEERVFLTDEHPSLHHGVEDSLSRQ
jgi:hypothetical protein